tara:strand:- start:27102 stop:27245 length:144 start_codon:yes stop_codon:yes gene_type:complete
MSKKNKKTEVWGGYKVYTLEDGTSFLAKDDKDAELYKKKVAGFTVNG